MNNLPTKYILPLMLITGIIIIFLLAIKQVNSPDYQISLSVSSDNRAKSPINKDKEKNKELTITIGGDVLLDRWLRTISNKHGYDYIFSDLKPILTQSDITLINLESPITDFESVSINSEPGSKENYIFTAPLSAAQALANNGVTLVNLGNNHINNFGETGLKQTKQVLIKNNIEYFGNTGLNNEKKYYLETINEIKIAFINYNQFINEGWEKVLEDLNEVKKTKPNLIIAFNHWGHEYQELSSEISKNQAHQLIDAGVDLVVGAHPHVIQQSEIYKDKYIYYSLGNLIMDQYFSQKTKLGLIIQILYNPSQNTYQIKEIPVEMIPSGKTIIINN